MKRSISNTFSRFSPQTIIFGVIILAFMVAAAALLPFYRYSLNPDGVGYFDVAVKYAHFHIEAAINGAWSPLLSWLLVPFVWTHRNLQLAYFLLAMLSSILSLLAIHKILQTFVTRWYVAATILIVAATTFLSWSFAGPITADVFLVTAGLWLPLSFKNFVQKRSWPSIILLAGNGAVFYLAKSIGFFVFAGTLIVFMALEYKRARGSDVFKCYILVGVSFFVLCAPWIGLISLKYKTLTVSTVGVTNLYLATQYDAVSNAYNIPLTVSGPYAPQPGDTTPWDDPSTFRDQMAEAFHSTPAPKLINNYYHSLLHNMNVLLTGIAPAVIALGSMGIFILYKKQKTITLALTLLSIITVIGCLLSYLELRYLYIVSVILLIGLAVIISQQVNKIALLGSILLLLMIIAPIQELAARKNTGRNIFFDAQTVAQVIPGGSEVLSDDPSVIYYCYYTNYHCHYTVVSTKGLANYIQSHHIHYFILSNVRNIVAEPDFWHIMQDQHVTVVRPAALAP